MRGSVDHTSLYCKATMADSVLGAGEPFTIKLALRRRTRADPSMAIKRVVVEVRRTIVRRNRPSIDLDTRSSSLDGADCPPTPPSDHSSADSASSTPLYTPDSLDPSYFGPVPRQHAPAKPEETTLMSLAVEGEEVVFGADGCWSATRSADMPRNKGHYHYSIGETVEQAGFSIKCLVHVKVRLAGVCTFRLSDSPSQVIFRGKTMAPIELPPAELVLSPLSTAERSVARARVHKVVMVQEAERKLFEPQIDGRCRAESSTRFGTGKKSGSRRHSDQEAPDHRGSRARFNSIADANFLNADLFSLEAAVVHRTSTSSTGDVIPSGTASRPGSRGRFFSVDEQYLRPPVSPVVEVDATPRVGSLPGPSPLLAGATPRLPAADIRPFTPPSDHDPPTDLFRNFAGFSLVAASELSPPASPRRPAARARDPGPKEITSSKDAPRPASLVRMHSDQAKEVFEAERRRSSLGRLFGRRSSRVAGSST
jgi:hypothetical protein